MRLLGQRAQHVVRLVSHLLDEGDTERFEEVADAAELRDEVVRHGIAMSLVPLVANLAEGRLGGVPCRDHMRRRELAEDGEQAVRVPVHRRDRLLCPRRRQHIAERVVRAEDDAVRVQDHEQRSVRGSLLPRQEGGRTLDLGSLGGLGVGGGGWRCHRVSIWPDDGAPGECLTRLPGEHSVPACRIPP